MTKLSFLFSIFIFRYG